MMLAPQRRAVGRMVIVAVVVIVLVIAAGAGIFYYSSSKTSTNTSNSSGNSSNTGTSSTTGSSGTGTVSTLTINDETWPSGNLNQLNAIGAIPYPNWLDYTVYQSLVTVNGTELYQNGTVQLLPMLATSWNSSADGKSWTMYLQHNVNFSNGDPFNAYQVWGELYGFYYLSGNNSGWAVGYSVFPMTGVNFGPSTLALMNSTKSQMISPNSQMLSIMENKSWPIYVVNQYELGFHLNGNFAYFPNIWVQFTGLMFDTQYVLNNGGFGTPASYNTAFNTSPIPGTGPYTVTKVIVNSEVDFTQNPTYWAKGWSAAQIKANPYMDPGHVKNVAITVQGDDLTRYVNLKTNQVDIAPVLTNDWSSVVNNSKFSYFVMPNSAANIVAIALNTQRYPTNITSFRQAMAAAINYSAISQQAFLGSEGGGATPMMGPTYPPYSSLYDLGNLPPYQYNVTLAKADLAASGVNTATMATMQFAVIQGCGTCLATAQIVVQDLSAIGIKSTVDIVPPSQYGPPVVAGSGTYPQEVNESQSIVNIMWFGTATFAPDEPTPADSWLTWVSNETSANNWAIYSNPKVQACVNDLTNGTPQSTLVQVCTIAQQQVTNDVPYIWLGSVKLFFGGGSIVWNNGVVKGFLADPVFSGQSATAIFNTVTFVNGQDD